VKTSFTPSARSLRVKRPGERVVFPFYRTERGRLRRASRKPPGTLPNAHLRHISAYSGSSFSHHQEHDRTASLTTSTESRSVPRQSRPSQTDALGGASSRRVQSEVT